MPREVRPGCARRRCRGKAVVLDVCRSHALKEADELFSLAVRSAWPGCMVGELLGAAGFEAPGPHAGGLQCAHLIDRRPYFAVRWTEANALALCAGHHRWVDSHTIEKREAMVAWFGPELWDKLRDTALANEPPDMPHVLAQLRIRAVGL